MQTRYSITVIDDATFYSGLPAQHAPQILNQVLVEPTFDIRYQSRLTFSTSLIGLSATYDPTPPQPFVAQGNLHRPLRRRF